jgi:hypothetical protein
MTIEVFMAVGITIILIGWDTMQFGKQVQTPQRETEDYSEALATVYQPIPHHIPE